MRAATTGLPTDEITFVLTAISVPIVYLCVLSYGTTIVFIGSTLTVERTNSSGSSYAVSSYPGKQISSSSGGPQRVATTISFTNSGIGPIIVKSVTYVINISVGTPLTVTSKLVVSGVLDTYVIATRSPCRAAGIVTRDVPES